MAKSKSATKRGSKKAGKSASKSTSRIPGATLVPIENLVPIQGALKKASSADREKLKSLIQKYGIAFPVIAGSPNKDGRQPIIAGHLRFNIYHETGIKQVPVVTVKATEKEARKMVLLDSGSYGKPAKDGILRYKNHIDDSIMELLAIPGIKVEELTEPEEIDPLLIEIAMGRAQWERCSDLLSQAEKVSEKGKTDEEIILTALKEYAGA